MEAGFSQAAGMSISQTGALETETQLRFPRLASCWSSVWKVVLKIQMIWFQPRCVTPGLHPCFFPLTQTVNQSQLSWACWKELCNVSLAMTLKINEKD